MLDGLPLVDVRRDVLRNIVSLNASEDLFDDLSDDPASWRTAQAIEDEVKPAPYRSQVPVIDRPFEEAVWASAIAWPFRHGQASRFSDGSFGVWYGSESVETTVWETAWHWYHGLLRDAGFDREGVVAERKVYAVRCDAALLDLRAATGGCPELLHPADYRPAQRVGARIHREGHPGLLVPSVRRPAGENVAVFNPAVLSDPRLECQLSYRLRGSRIEVEKQPGRRWLRLDVARL